jgi:hypothetical protein
MMSELANGLLDAIASGDQEKMNAAFKTAMDVKINDSLQARKIELAQRIYGDAIEQESSDAVDDAESGTEETVSSNDGSEEV